MEGEGGAGREAGVLLLRDLVRCLRRPLSFRGDEIGDERGDESSPRPSSPRASPRLGKTHLLLVLRGHLDNMDEVRITLTSLAGTSTLRVPCVAVR